jgi:hypothetical protein
VEDWWQVIEVVEDLRDANFVGKRVNEQPALQDLRLHPALGRPGPATGQRHGRHAR